MTKTTEVYIYALSDPDSGEVRYIGKANNPEKRLKSHMRDSVRRDYPVYRWIRKLSAAGKSPVMKVLSSHIGDEWMQAEREAIDNYRENGCRLLNVAIGGIEPYCSDELRSKNGKDLIKRIRTDDLVGKVWQLKRWAGDMMRDLKKRNDQEGIEMLKARMRNMANLMPDHFPLWRKI